MPRIDFLLFYRLLSHYNLQDLTHDLAQYYYEAMTPIWRAEHQKKYLPVLQECFRSTRARRCWMDLSRLLSLDLPHYEFYIRRLLVLFDLSLREAEAQSSTIRRRWPPEGPPE